LAESGRECRRLLFRTTSKVVEDENTKTEKRKLNHLRKSRSKQETKVDDESYIIKLENVRSFASIIIELYFSKQENEKL
jgi:hypothetical protein